MKDCPTGFLKKEVSLSSFCLLVDVVIVVIVVVVSS